MKHLLVLAAFLAFACGITSAAGVETGGPGDAGIYTTQLKNGLHVVVVEDRAAPVVQSSVWYHFGSLDEVPGRTGLAHALEHMMFRGTNQISAGGLDDIVARLGAQMNAQTTYDYTQFYFVMPADKLDVALQIEADRMHDLALRQADWNVERQAVLNELEGDRSSPFFSLLSRVRAAAYPNQPEGRTPIGLRQDIERANAADIARYYHEWYAPNNATLVIAGAVDHTNVFARAQRFFGALPSHPLAPHQATHPAPIAQTVSVESDLPFPFEILDLAYAVPGDTEPGEPAISTLVQVLGNQLSPFYQALVQTNVALAVEAQQDTQLRGGLFNVFIVLNPGHTAAEAQQIFQATMENAIKNGFNPDLIAASKRLTIAERLYSGDSITGMGDLAGYTYGIVGEKIQDEDDRLAQLTPASIQAIAARYLARPTVIGHLRTRTEPSKGASQKSDAAISDNFSGRVPNGPIVEPAAIRAALSEPTTARSPLAPTAFTLDNGIKVLVQEKHDRQTFVLAGDIASSSAFVPSGKEGIARLAAAVADYGSAAYPFAQRRRAVDMMGAVVHNGDTFNARGLARDFAEIAKIVADGEVHPAFSDPWFGIEKEQLANSLASENTISGVMIDRAYARLLANPVDPSLRVASAQSVGSITREDLLEYAHAYWRPDLTTISVVGDVTPAQVKSALEAAFGDWKSAGATPDVRQVAYERAHSGHDWIGTEASQVYIRLGQPAVARDNPDYDALLVLNQILGASGAFESRLWQELRQKRGLVYSINSSVHAGRDRGDLRIEMNASPARVRGAVSLVRNELTRLQNEPVSATELQEAKLRIVSNALLDEASADGLADQLLDIGTNHLPLDYYRALNDRFASITAADVQRVAKTYLVPDRLVEIFAGPSGPWAQQNL